MLATMFFCSLMAALMTFVAGYQGYMMITETASTTNPILRVVMLILALWCVFLNLCSAIMAIMNRDR